MALSTNRVDSEITNLSGGLFDALPRQEMPLESYRLQEKVIEPADFDHAATLVMRRVKLDSIAPMALTPPVVELGTRREKRSGVWSYAVAAFGVACLLVSAVRFRPSQPMANVPVQAALVMAPEAAPVVVAEPARAEPAKVAPVARPAKPFVKPVVKAASAAAAPESTADLPFDVSDLPPPPKAVEGPFQASAAAVSIAAAGMRAVACKDQDGSMAVPVSVTFVGSGRATRVIVNGGPFRGTPAGACISRTLRSTSVPPFDGEPVTVTTNVHL